jgi:KDO2-lipid IV(A) lauroyltransferase
MAEPAARAYRIASATARLLPERVALGCGRVAGRFVGRVAGARRAQVERNLRRVRGRPLREAELRAGVRKTFQSYAHYWVESFRLPDVSPAELDAGMFVDGWEHLEHGLDAGKGVILALPHLGGWEWAGFWLATVRHVPVTVVVEPLDPPELFEWFADFRRRLGMQIVALGPKAGTAVLQALKANHVLCLLCDRDLQGDGIEVEFFGERTTLPAGPATLALRTGAPLLPTAVYFDTGGFRHLGVISPPLDATRTGRLRDDVTRVTQALAHELEHLISRAPDQWHLLQPNWPSDGDGSR